MCNSLLKFRSRRSTKAKILGWEFRDASRVLANDSENSEKTPLETFHSIGPGSTSEL